MKWRGAVTIAVASVLFAGACAPDYEECFIEYEAHCRGDSMMVECIATNGEWDGDPPRLVWWDRSCGEDAVCVDSVNVFLGYSIASCISNDQPANRCGELCDLEAGTCPSTYEYCVDDQILHTCSLGYFRNAKNCLEDEELACGMWKDGGRLPRCLEPDRDDVIYGADAYWIPSETPQR